MADKKASRKNAKPLGKKDMKGTKGGLNFAAQAGDPPSEAGRFAAETPNLAGKYISGKFQSP